MQLLFDLILFTSNALPEKNKDKVYANIAGFLFT